jgi:hypothetical protein
LDAALRSIADNLAALRLDPVLHLKIAVAIVAPLMGGAGEPVPAPPPRNPRVQPKTASSRLPTVHWANLEGQLRVVLPVGHSSGE